MKSLWGCISGRKYVFSTHWYTLFFLTEATRLSASDPVKDLGSRSPFRAPNSQKTAINYDKLGCHTWGCSWALLGCFWASPGLLGLSEGSRAAPSCLWAAPVASLLEPRKIMKMTSLMTNRVTWWGKLKPQRIFWDSGRVWRARAMYEVCPRLNIIKF